MRRAARGALSVVAAIAALMASAAAAGATFHDVWIREVYAGSVAEPNAEYVELQMFSDGQNFIAGHTIRTYDAAGSPVGSSAFPGRVDAGSSQSTILMATPEATAQFGVAADAQLDPSNQLSAAGGAVCWEAIDCVSWGGFKGSLPSPAGPPAVAIPDGMALRRTIAPGCPTLLERADDRDDSALDFSAVFPAPRPNSTAPNERPCSSATVAGAGGTEGGNRKGAPQTTLRRKPAKRVYDRTPTFRFASDEAGSTFQCKLDGKAFRRCGSPFTAKRLSLGPHTFKVRARDGDGRLDPSPASYRFRVLARP